MSVDDTPQHESWQRIAPQLRLLSKVPDGKGHVAWLAEKLHYKIQRVQNWITRGVPASEHAAIAAVLGWTVAQVAGVKDPPEAWPFETIAPERWERLTERQKAMIELAAVREFERIEASAHRDDASRKLQVNDKH